MRPPKVAPPAPLPQPNRISGLNGALPTIYTDGWQLFTDLSSEQIVAYQAMPEWQDYLSYVALSPDTATAGMSQVTIINALNNAGRIVR